MKNSGSNQFESFMFKLPVDNVDTDQIYPGRHLTTIDKKGLGKYCFQDWRENPESTQFPFFQNLDTAQQKILLAGDNFGCGSSREHAVWSLLDIGFKAVVSTRFGDIFYTNALNNGLLLITVDQQTHDFLLENGQNRLIVDIASQEIEMAGLGRKSFPLDKFTASCLINGTSPLDYLLQHRREITAFETEGQR